MQLLIESHERAWLSLGALASAAIHVSLLAFIVIAYRQAPDQPSFAEQFVTYLVPPDQTPPQDGRAEQPAWTGDQGTEGVGDAPASPEGTGPLVTGATESKDTVPVEAPSDPMAELLEESSVMTELEVDSAVRRYPESAAPKYPAVMLARNIEGYAMVLYVVDSTGLVDTTTFRVVRATDPAFVEAVRDALPGMRFRPALLQGQPVRQLVQQPFSFKIRRDSTAGRPLNQKDEGT